MVTCRSYDVTENMMVQVSSQRSQEESWCFGTYKGTSPSGEKLRAEIAAATSVSDAPASKVGSPGGPLASRTFIFVTLHFNQIPNLDFWLRIIS